MLKRFPVEVVPNTLDKIIFKKLNKSFSREALNLKKNKKYILFGAMSATTTSYKGWDYLKEALVTLDKKNLKLKENIELLVFGASYSKDIDELPFKTRFLGRVYDETTLALIYNSADVFVIPSKEDNYPNTLNESLSCGLFSIGFDIGGIPDMIKNGKNGILIKPYETLELANKLNEYLEENNE